MWQLMVFFKFASLTNWLIIAAVALAWPAASASGLDSDRRSRRAARRCPRVPSTRGTTREDQLRRIDVRTPRESVKNRGSMWQAEPSKPRDFSWLEYLLNALGIALRWLIWIGLGVLLVGLIVLLARGLVMREERAPRPTRRKRPPNSKPTGSTTCPSKSRGLRTICWPKRGAVTSGAITARR
jgi:hypothetical protein